MAKKLVRSFYIFIILTILLAQFGIRPAAAATNFTVNSTADKVDANIGNGICETATPGECTLRAAIQEANALGGADTISIPAGTYTLSIAGAGENVAATGDLDITDDLTVTGAGMDSTIIDANNLDRVFHVRFASLALSDLTVQNGLADPGGAVLVDNYASITRVTFNNNQSTSTTPTGAGGAIYISGEASADITQSHFNNNLANYGGGAVASSNTTVFSISDSTFTSNNGGFGGGALYPNGGSAVIENSTFLNNTADSGGALHSNADSVTVDNSTFVGNSAVNKGAIDARAGTIIVNNSTFSGNTASGLGDTLGGQPAQGGVLQVSNSIISGVRIDNCDGSVVDLGNNLSWPAGNDCPGTQGDPLLGSLADNGGQTETMAISSGSPAIDAGNNATCTSSDQRGVARPQGVACDIGAYEFENASSNIFVVTNVNDSGAGSLRQAIIDANAAPNSVNGPDEIHFSIPGAGVQTIAPATNLPTISEAVVIDGTTQPGANCTAWPPNLLIELDGSGAGSVAYGLDFGTFGADGSTIRGLVINRFYIGINGAYSSNNTFECNFIGTNASGTAAAGNTLAGIYFQQNSDNNTIGGPLDTQRNLISANSTYQISFPNFSNSTTSPSNNLIQNNYIGTNVTGLAALGGGSFAVNLYGTDHNVIRDNLISGNSGYGIYISGDTGRPSGNHTIQGNRIGVDGTGNGPLGNGSFGYPNGISVGLSQDDIIGGIGEGEANIIANNFGAGVSLADTLGDVVRGNSIFNNGGTGIDLGGDGITFNHAGIITGPNNYQNYPVLSTASSDGNTTRVVGTLVSSPNQSYTIDVFSNETCDPASFGEGKNYLDSFAVNTDGNGMASFDESLGVGIPEPLGVTATATGSNGTSEFSYCRPVSTTNLNWVQAQPVASGSQTLQYITDRFQEKWFKFPVGPGSTVRVKLTGLPGSAISLHRDPYVVYNGLINPQNAAVLSAEAADTAFLPSGSLPSGSLPSGSLPSGSLPSGSLPSGSLPTGYLPSGSLPSGSLPSGSLPSGSLPSGSLPSGSLPSGSLPSGSLPSGSLPSGSLPSGSLPSGSLPSGSLPSGSLPSGSLPSGSLDAYASAARRSLLGISMDPYATVQTIERNTYDLQGDLYVRVVGPYNIAMPFSLDVTVQGGICGAVQPVPNGLAVVSGQVPASGSSSLILTDSSRLHGTTVEIEAALTDLETLAGRADVNGIVIDLSESKYERVAFANSEADDNLGCASAKNTVASEIKKVIEVYREANPNLEYIVLAGGADVIPFFQVQDVSGLANEKDYVVPVAPSTASEAGLKTNLVQGQDGYGSQVEITQAGHTLALPGLAVGRLVDTASDISTAVNAFIQTDGVIVPHATLVTGYDFVGDAAAAVKTELDAGTNSTADTLIQDPGLSPSDPSAWTADQMRAKLLAGNFDIVMLSGHFSAGNLLAADYATKLSAAEIAASSTDLTDDLFLALGCHGGYTIPSSDLLAGASPDPDWAKAFLRKGAAGYISATGYAYGDTELTEYGERLFLLMAQQLRTGSGPVSIGQAVVKAKQQYLAETAQLTGIDQKTIVEMTLYGLPMMKVDMPGARINPQAEDSIVTTTDPVASGPGANFGLISSGIVTLNIPSLTTHTKSLLNLSDNSQVTTTYLSGPDGVVANPFEPIYPKVIYNSSANGNVLRGVALRGGNYDDQTNVIPLTSSPTTETSTAHLSYNTDVFYPTQTWAPNYYDAFTGGNTRLVVFPAQYRSRAPGVIDGTRRTFSQLKLELFYLPASWTDSNSPATKAAAVSAAPNIQGASGLENGNDVIFSVNAVAEGSAGVQAVWVLYTGKPGSSYHGTWTPLDLTQSTSDPTLWEGTLILQSGASADDILFMVQAVGGAGLTTLATNLGAYYSVTPENAGQLPPPAETVISLQPITSSGTYLKESTFTLSLTAAGRPLAGQLVSLNIGGQQAFEVTDSSGEATISMTLVVPPGDYTVQASFRGNAEYLSSNDASDSDFTVNKEETTLTVTPTETSIFFDNSQIDQPTPIVAVVRDSSGRALGGKSVLFVIHNSSITFVRSVIANYLGHAPLGAVPLLPGTYTVDVYFNGMMIPVGNGQTLTLSDSYYNSSNLLGLSLQVVFNFTGFFQPVKNPPVLNQVNAGRAIPLKFSLNGDQGLDIFVSGFPRSRQIVCDTSESVDDVQETMTAGSSNLSYDPTTDQYNYVWKTAKSWSGTCRQVTMEFVDGQIYMLNFKFK